MSMGFTPLRRLLGSAAQRAGITRDLTITRVLRVSRDALADIFGERAPLFAEPVAMRKDGTLVIACRSTVAAQTVRLRERDILARVRAAVPRLHIERLFLIPRSREDVRGDEGVEREQEQEQEES